MMHSTLLTSTAINESQHQLKKVTPASNINAWMRSFNKWISILEQWKLEAKLIDRLATLSVIGEEATNRRLHELQGALRNFMETNVRELETSILEMQRNSELLERCLINSEEKIRACKIRMQKSSTNYSNLKNAILREVANVYPVTFQ